MTECTRHGYQALSYVALVFFALCTVAQAMTVAGEFANGMCVEMPESTAFTASVWVNAETSGTNQCRYPRIFQFPGGYLHLSYPLGARDAESSDLILEFAVPKDRVPKGASRWSFFSAVPFRQWAHIALVARADSNIVPEVYVNGVRVPSRARMRPMPDVFPGGRLCVGNTAQGGNRPLTGRLADFRFEPSALDAATIAEMARIAPDGKPPKPFSLRFSDELPIVDFSRDASSQTVIASGADGVYQGHPTTAVAPDGTIYCVWTINHGGKCGPMAKSTDGGKTWTRCDGVMPAGYHDHANCPTLQSIVRPDGGTNLVVFSAKKGGCGIVISPDGGKSWWEAPTAKLSAGMPPTGFMMLKDGTAALFGQIRNDPKIKTDHATDDQSVWMSISKDGGWTWGPMRIVATTQQKNLCEPFCLRSPDGMELCLLIRENRHTARSMMCFSRDEGKTWTKPEDTCWGLTGDRHEGIYLPDGRLFIAFRDQAKGSSTKGQYVAWVGTYDDLRAGKPGDCRIHILEHVGERAWDTGYSGVELLSDDTILCTTYIWYRPADRANSVVCARIPISRIPRREDIAR